MDTHTTPLRYRSAPTALSRAVGDEVVVLDLAGEQYFGLDRVGATIWEALAEPCTVGDIARVLVDRFDVDEDTARRDAGALIDQLVASGLAETA